LCWDIHDFKQGYQPRINLLKDEKGDLVTGSQSALDRWKNHFSQLSNVHGLNDIIQAEIHAAEPLVPEPNAFEIEMALEKLKRQQSLRIDKIPAELIKARSRKIHSEIINLLILFGIRSNCLRSGS
jgi:hypothetical protein